jgi:hypothetical protein
MLHPAAMYLLIGGSGAAAIGLAVAGWHYWQASVKKVRAEWRAVAQRHDLTVHEPTFWKSMRLDGGCGSVGVEIKTISRGSGQYQQAFRVVRARVPACLPAGLGVSRMNIGTKVLKAFGGQDVHLDHAVLDERLRIRGENEAAVQQVLTHPDGLAALAHLLGGASSTRLEKDVIIIEHSGSPTGNLQATLDSAVAAANLLADAVRAPWARLAETHGLSLTHTGLASVLTGRVGGVPIVVETHGALGDAVTTIRAGIPGGWLEGAQIVPGGGGVRLRDPVLDGRIAASGPGVEAYLLARLDDPRVDLHGCLLDVLQGMPGAEVMGDEVSVELPGRSGSELAEQLNRVTALAQALAAPATSTDDGLRTRQAARAKQRQ